MKKRSRRAAWAAIALAGTASLCGCQSLPRITWKEKANLPHPVDTPQATTPVATAIAQDVPEKPTPKMMVNFGQLRVQMHQYPEAADLFERALREEPKNIDARVGLAKVKCAMALHTQAVDILKTGLAKSPKAAPLWNELGIAYANLKQYDDAVAALEKAHKFDPPNDLYLTNLAGVFAVMGKSDESYRFYTQVMSAADARVQIAKIAGGQGRMDVCQKQLAMAVETDPTNQEAHKLLNQIDTKVQAVGYQTQN